MEEEAILDISTKPQRPKIKIDGVLYEMSVPEDFKLQEFLWMADTTGETLKDADLSKKDALKVLDKICRKALRRVPNRVYSKLSYPQKMGVINAFFETAAVTLGEVPRQVGLKYSPASKDSTEEPSKVGSEQT